MASKISRTNDPHSAAAQRILISGGSGMIGTALVRSWMSEPIHITQLIRGARRIDEHSAIESVVWDPRATHPFPDPNRLGGTQIVIHLSGANVAAHRWTESYKREILSSRVQSTRALVKALTALDPVPETLICASAVGIYGDRGDAMLAESAQPGSGFLADTCVAWEAAAQSAAEAGIRVVHARLGVVLSPQGGALAKMLPLFRLGLGGKLGDGQAWMPWLTLREAVGIIRFCAENPALSGAVNAVAPTPARNAEFTRVLAETLHCPAVVPAPAFVMRLAFGQMADEALLASARVVPQKLVEAGYRFADPEIGPAMRRLLSS